MQASEPSSASYPRETDVCNPLVTLARRRRPGGCEFNRPENEKTAEFRGFGRLEKLERAKGFEPSTPTLASEKLRRRCIAPDCGGVRQSARDCAVIAAWRRWGKWTAAPCGQLARPTVKFGTRDRAVTPYPLL